jgi:hypothetical protein
LAKGQSLKNNTTADCYFHFSVNLTTAPLEDLKCKKIDEIKKICLKVQKVQAL